MWNYTKCTSADREEALKQLEDFFKLEKNCSKYLSDRQQIIHSTQATIVLLQDLDYNLLIEMDYVPVNDYAFRVVDIEESGIKRQGHLCKTIEEAISQFVALCR